VSAVEHRDDIELILLNGLPEQERLQTMESIANATAKKLAHLRAMADAPRQSADFAPIVTAHPDGRKVYQHRGGST
jgi:hypothetical protein